MALGRHIWLSYLLTKDNTARRRPLTWPGFLVGLAVCFFSGAEVVCSQTAGGFTAAAEVTYSKKEIRATCNKYEGSFIASYGNVYYVQNCKRRPVVDSELIFRLTKGKTPIVEVGNEVIAMLPDGDPLISITKNASIRTCRDLQGQYVSYASSELYFVDHCKRHLLPDWETYVNHRHASQGKSAMNGVVIDLTWEEFHEIPAGKAVPSIIDKQNREKQSDVIEILPLDEACQGLNGRYVSYYSKLYRIDQCRKREVMDIEKFFFQRRGKEVNIKELSSDQWISLPDGKKIDNR